MDLAAIARLNAIIAAGAGLIIGGIRLIDYLTQVRPIRTRKQDSLAAACFALLCLICVSALFLVALDG